MMRRTLVLWGIVLPALFAPTLAAQEAPVMLATPRYLFVLRGDSLHQFDIDTLKLLHRVRLETPAQPLAEPAPPPPPPPRRRRIAEDAPVAEGPVAVAHSAEAPLASGRFGAGGRFGARGAGGPAPVNAAVEAGLQWLKNHQDENGKWDCDGFMKHDEGAVSDGPGNSVHDVGVTGLALLAFLGSGSTMRSGPFKEQVKKGVLWLKDQQQENGLFGTNASHDFIYSHAIATYAMCEAFGLSQYTLLKPYAQKGINYLESHRNPYSVWRYQPRDNDNDTSVTGWCILAYESGEFFGLEINKAALDVCKVWLDSVSDATGKHGYSKAGEPSSRMPGDHATKFPVEKGEAMTAVGLFCRFFMGQKPEEKPVMKAAANLILSKPPIWDPTAGTIDEYYWYFGTYAMFQMGGRHWAEWQKKLTAAVIKPQHRDETKPHLHGSWDPIGVWGEAGGRVYSTALMTLSLEAWSRYTRLVR